MKGKSVETESAPVAKVIFACVHNAGRSQMARAWFERLADPALTVPAETADRVHPIVVEAMDERGIDLRAVHPQRLTSELARDAALLVTMGCGEACPYVPGLAVVDWPLRDPKGQGIASVREIRDEIEKRVTDLVVSRGWARKA